MKEKRIRGITLIKISILVAVVSLSLSARVNSHSWFGILPQTLCSAEEQKPDEAQKPSSASKKTDNSVTVYVTSWCPACTMAINYLKENKIPFTAKDVEKNPDYMKEMVAKIGGYRGVPVIIVDGKAHLGFHPSMVEHLKP